MSDITAATQNPAVNAATVSPDVAASTPDTTDMMNAQAVNPEASDAQRSASDTSATDNNSLTADIKKGVEDFDRALDFVEQGVALLGAAAKAELKVLAQKYL